MKALLAALLLLPLFAVPAAAHPHGAKSKGYYGKSYRARYIKRTRRHRYLRRYRVRHCASSGPYKYFRDIGFWASCAFAPKDWR